MGVVHIQLTKFIDLQADGSVMLDKDGDKTKPTYGYTIHDNYSSVVCKAYDSQEDLLEMLLIVPFWKLPFNYTEFSDLGYLNIDIVYNGKFYDTKDILRLDNEFTK